VTDTDTTVWLVMGMVAVWSLYLCLSARNDEEEDDD
jgi:hypothetical protein